MAGSVEGRSEREGGPEIVETRQRGLAGGGEEIERRKRG